MSSQLVADRYRLGRRIGTGGMGRVWLARDEVLRRPVAVKEVLLPEGLSEAETQEMRMRTLREARAAARLSHPNVVKVYDVLYTEDRPWIVMEYIPSRSLAQVIKEDGPLPPTRAAQVGLSVLGALCAAHAGGVLHRDVKPGNVLLADDGRVVLTDFGLATYDEVGAALTQSGVVHGSPQFIAPERALDGTSSVAADMWSLGATLYAAVEGRSPYARGSSFAVLTALATAPPDPPQRAGPLKPVLSGLLRRNPDARMPAGEVKARLHRIISPDPGRSRLMSKQRKGEGDSTTIENLIASPSHAAPRRVTPIPRLSRRGSDSGRMPWSRRTEIPAVASGPVSPAEAGAWTPHSTVDLDREMDRAWADGSHDAVSGVATPRMPLARPEHRPRRIRPVVALSLGAVLLVATAAWAVSKSGGAPARTGTAGSPSTSPSASPSGVAPPVGPTAVSWPCDPVRPAVTFPLPAAATSRAFSVVNGWQLMLDVGHRPVGVTSGWRMTGVDGTICMYDPASSWVEGINHTRPNTDSATVLLTQRETQVAAERDGYQRIHLGRDPANPAFSDWDFRFRSSGVLTHVLVSATINPDGSADEIWWQTPESDWSPDGGPQDNLIAWFQVAHTPRFGK